MGYAISAESFKLRFPQFRHQPSSRIEFAIEEASLQMTDPANWVDQKNYLVAFSYLAAHYLMVSIQREESGTDQVAASDRIGADFSVSYVPAAEPSETDHSDFTTTHFGLRYMQLLRLNFPPVAVV